MNVFYTWLQVSNAKIATLSNINTSSGKAVFSGTLEKQAQLACVVSAVSWCLGIMTFSKRERKKLKHQFNW